MLMPIECTSIAIAAARFELARRLMSTLGVYAPVGRRESGAVL
jgi:hypothetical protein